MTEATEPMTDGSDEVATLTSPEHDVFERQLFWLTTSLTAYGVVIMIAITNQNNGWGASALFSLWFVRSVITTSVLMVLWLSRWQIRLIQWLIGVSMRMWVPRGWQG